MEGEREREREREFGLVNYNKIFTQDGCIQKLNLDRKCLISIRRSN